MRPGRELGGVRKGLVGADRGDCAGAGAIRGACGVLPAEKRTQLCSDSRGSCGLPDVLVQCDERLGTAPPEEKPLQERLLPVRDGTVQDDPRPGDVAAAPEQS